MLLNKLNILLLAFASFSNVLGTNDVCEQNSYAAEATSKELSDAKVRPNDERTSWLEQLPGGLLFDSLQVFPDFKRCCYFYKEQLVYEDDWSEGELPDIPNAPMIPYDKCLFFKTGKAFFLKGKFKSWLDYAIFADDDLSSDDETSSSDVADDFSDDEGYSEKLPAADLGSLKRKKRSINDRENRGSKKARTDSQELQIVKLLRKEGCDDEPGMLREQFDIMDEKKLSDSDYKRRCEKGRSFFII